MILCEQTNMTFSGVCRVLMRVYRKEKSYSAKNK